MKIRLRKYGILVIIPFAVMLWIMTGPAYAQTWDALVRPVSGIQSRTPAIAVADGTIHLVYFQSVGSPAVDEVVYKQSNHPGSTWPATETKISTCTEYGGETGIATAGNTIHVVWSEEGLSAGTRNIYYSRSTDNGSTFSAKQTLNQAAGHGGSPVIAVSENTVHVAWKDFRHSGRETYYRRSTDGGVTWETEQRLTQTPNLWERDPQIAVNQQNVYIVVQADGAVVGSDHEIYLIRSTDGGQNWESVQAITQSKVNKWETAIAVTNERVHVVYCTVTSGSSDATIEYLRNDNAGLSAWSDPVVVASSTTSIDCPSLAAFNDNLFLVWEDGRGGSDEECDLYYNTASQHGESWAGEQVLYQSVMQHSGAPSTAAAGGEFYAAWYEEQFDEAVFMHGTMAAYTFSGHVYQGDPPDETTPLSGIVIELYGDDDELPRNGNEDLRSTIQTGASGSFSINNGAETRSYLYYHVLQVDNGTYSTGAEVEPPGTMKDFNCVTYHSTDLAPGTVYGGIVFWDKPLTPWAYNFAGHVYHGHPPDQSTPLGGITIELWGDDNQDPDDGPGDLITAEPTNAFGDFFFHSAMASRAYDYYHVMEVDPTGFSSVAAEADLPGIVTHENCVTYRGSDLTAGTTYEENNFWDESGGTGAYTFAGRVFQGHPPDVSTPMEGVALELLADDNDNPDDGVGPQLDMITTSVSGEYVLTTDQDFNFYHIIETDPPDFVPIEVLTPPPGFVNNPNCVTFNRDDLVPGMTYEPVDFWDEHGTAVDSDGTGLLPDRFVLRQNYPNPFNPSTRISYALPRRSRTVLEIFNVHGHKVKTLVDGSIEAGMHTVIWDGTDTTGNRVVSGLYLCRMKTSGFRQIIRMLFLK